MSRFEHYLRDTLRFGIRPGLDRIRALLQRAGNPHREYSCVLVGGTNGKGSTCEFLARALAHQSPTALYTSPHIYRYNERIRVLSTQLFAGNETDDQLFAGALSDAEIDAAFDIVKPHLDAVTQELGAPTEFETLTLLALCCFAQRKVKRAVIEVGLGGSWDTTNAIEPLVSVITHVALDHCDRLGNTVEEIARDKAGIARKNRPLVTAAVEARVLSVLREECENRGARLWPFRAPQFSNDTAHFPRAMELALPHLPPRVLLGGAEFQEINAATALFAHLALLHEEKRLREENPNAPFELPPDTILPRVAPVPGRTETLRENPLILLDGANNPDGAAHLSTHLQGVLSEKRGRKLFLVLGVSADKDYRAMAQILTPPAHTVFAAQANNPRALPADELARALSEYSADVKTCPDVNQALRRALQMAAPDDCICVCGSFFLLGDVQRALWVN